MNAARLERIWYAGEPAPFWLRALVPVYRSLRAVARFAWTIGLRRPQRLPVPVIVVGNLSVGGTGKTPLVIALVEALRARGMRPGVVSRGYGGSTRAPTLLDKHADPIEVGDEPCLIRHRTRAMIAVGRDRPAAARLLLDAGVDVIIADDGLQNPALARDVEICVIDGVRRFGNGRLLPAGPLRESRARLQRVDFRVCNGGVAHPDEVQMHLVGNVAVALAGEPTSRPLNTFSGERVHALAAIGNPQRFFAALREYGIEVIEHAFPDHHAFQPGDIEFSDELDVLMTEKDAVKCAGFATARHWCVPASAQLAPGFFDAVAVRCGNSR